VFGKPRFEEHELRAEGLDYMDIAKRAVESRFGS